MYEQAGLLRVPSSRVGRARLGGESTETAALFALRALDQAQQVSISFPKSI